MTYEREDGTHFSITKHTQEEWASKVKAQLIGLECSEEYTQKIVDGYLKAKPTEIKYGFRGVG